MGTRAVGPSPISLSVRPNGLGYLVASTAALRARRSAGRPLNAQSVRRPRDSGALIRIFAATLLLVHLSATASRAEPESTCFGTTSEGRLETGWRLPTSGPNYTAYSTIGVLAGRTSVHSRVHRVLLSAYAALAESSPRTVFMYAETGKRKGGPFPPHKTHQNGLSVDHMVPMRDAGGRSVHLPTSPFNRLGYDIDLDSRGRHGDLALDSLAMTELLYELHRASLAEGVEIWRVIFDPQLQPLLHDSPRWPYLEKHLEFSRRLSWVRHDEHFHVDFRVPCS